MTRPKPSASRMAQAMTANPAVTATAMSLLGALFPARLVGTEQQIGKTEAQRFRGSSGKLNLMFRNPVKWKHDTGEQDADQAFRYLFPVETLDALNQAALAVDIPLQGSCIAGWPR